MSKFLVSLFIFLLVAGLAGYYAMKQGYLTEPPVETPALTPEDYHVLGGRGGVPLAEATRAGLATDSYAYLYSMDPINSDRGISQQSGIKLGGLNYDLGYIFESRPGETQSLEFNLLGQWSELHFGFGFTDNEASDPENKWAIEFSINVDGETRYGPESLTPVDKPVFSRVDVLDANRVTFVVKRVNSSNPFAPVLVDPFVLKQ